MSSKEFGEVNGSDLNIFDKFFASPNFWLLIKNTIGISFYSLIAGFPVPIVLALALNEVRTGFFKRSVQMITYAPHFISTVVMVSIIILMLSPHVGIVDHFFSLLGMPMTNFHGHSGIFQIHLRMVRHLAGDGLRFHHLYRGAGWSRSFTI